MDAASGKRTDSGDSLDRISDLHDSLKENILERLPVTDAIKTSVLSRKWRSSWTKIQLLVFNKSFVEDMGIRCTEARFCRNIERILILHQGSLKKLVVDIPQHFRTKALYMNGWFISLSKKGVQELEINYNLRLGPSCFFMPPDFFLCRELTHLSLGAHMLRPPPDFQGFQNLVSLDLAGIEMRSYELSEFIFRSPLIERLSLTDVLEWFSTPLDICAPNMRILLFKDYVSGMIILKNTPSLAVVSLQCLENMDVRHKKGYSSFELLSSLSGIEEITFDLPLLEPIHGDCPNNLATEFGALKLVTLGRVNISSRNDILFIFCLLRSSPNLTTLNISMHYATKPLNREVKVGVECLEAEARKDNSFRKLRRSERIEVRNHACQDDVIQLPVSRDCGY